MNSVTRSLLGVALAAGAMYIFDPDSGHRRRVLLRDRCARAAKRLELRTRDARHEVSHQVHDLTAKARTQLARRKVNDKALLKQARAAIARASSHPEAIASTVHDGHVYLRGDVLTYEHQPVLDEMRSLEGVRVITDHLTIREPHEGVRRVHDGEAHDGWSVAGRIFVGATGCALVLWGIKERKTLGELGASTWRSKNAPRDRTEEIRSALETGIEDARSASHAATDTSSDVVESIHGRTREGDSGAQGTAREGFVM